MQVGPLVHWIEESFCGRASGPVPVGRLRDSKARLTRPVQVQQLRVAQLAGGLEEGVTQRSHIGRSADVQVAAVRVKPVCLYVEVLVVFGFEKVRVHIAPMPTVWPVVVVVGVAARVKHYVEHTCAAQNSAARPKRAPTCEAETRVLLALRLVGPVEFSFLQELVRDGYVGDEVFIAARF